MPLSPFDLEVITVIWFLMIQLKSLTFLAQIRNCWIMIFGLIVFFFLNLFAMFFPLIFQWWCFVLFSFQFIWRVRQNPFVSMDELITCVAVVFNKHFYETSVHSVCSLKKKRVSYGDQRAANIGLCTENNVLIYYTFEGVESGGEYMRL